MSELEQYSNMTDAEADIETLADIRENLGQFAVIESIFNKGEQGEV